MGRLEGRTSAKLADHLERRAPSVTVESTGSVHKRAAEHA